MLIDVCLLIHDEEAVAVGIQGVQGLDNALLVVLQIPVFILCISAAVDYRAEPLGEGNYWRYVLKDGVKIITVWEKATEESAPEGEE